MSVKFAFIDGEKDHFPISRMCAWLGVSSSGFYEWKDRAPSPTSRRRERLAAMITAIFEANHGTYGYRRVHAVLLRSGEQVSDELVRDLMRELGLVACQPRPWRPTTTDPDDRHRIPDLVGRDFTAEVPGTKLVGDITLHPDRGRLGLPGHRDRLLLENGRWMVHGRPLQNLTYLLRVGLRGRRHRSATRMCFPFRSRLELHFL